MLGARIYDPALGRFLQRDPIAYVGGPRAETRTGSPSETPSTSLFQEAAKNADGIKFDVSSYDVDFPKPGVTAYELNQILGNSSLLDKTTFIRAGQKVIWSGSGFVTP